MMLFAMASASNSYAETILNCRSVDERTGKVSELNVDRSELSPLYGPYLALFDGRKIELNVQQNGQDLYVISAELYDEGNLVLVGKGSVGGPTKARFYLSDSKMHFNFLCISNL